MMVFKSRLRRYPGTKPFTRDQASLFFGRAGDIKRLNELIALESVVVVYGKSGYGKSSLINAGLLPQLEVSSDNICLMPRLNAWQDSDSISPLDKTRENIKTLSKDYSILDKVLEDDDSLWRKLKAFQIANPGKRLHLFFDQFEELFTYPAAQVNEFKLQVAELVRKQVPRRYERALDIKGAVDDEVLAFEEEDLLYQRLNLRLVFIIRSDKMHLLDQLSDYIPKILKNNYEIKALTRPSAASALIEPALLKGPGYLTPEFEYDRSAQDKVLDFLEDDNTKLVEAIQLQILATSFEDKVHQKELKVLNSENIGDLESIVKNYYNDRLRSLGSMKEIALASKMIEEGLVDKERYQRLTLHEGQIKSIYDVDEDLLNKLVENHLLRRQPDARSGYNYELSHDTLISPVLAARSIREKKEAEEEYARTQLELDKEKSRRRKATFIAIIAALASILAGYYAYTAFQQEKTINNQRDINAVQAKQNKRQQELNEKQLIAIDSIEITLENQKERSDSLSKVAVLKDIQATNAYTSARFALAAADSAKQMAIVANENFANEVEKGKDLEELISGNNPYAVDFLTEEGDRQLANKNFQNALTYYATAKFVLEPDTINNKLIYRKLLERVRVSALMSEIENLFQSGFFTLCVDKMDEIYEMDLSGSMLDRIDASLVNREIHIDTSEHEWSKALNNAINRYGNVEEIEHINIGSPSEPSRFVSLPYMGTEGLLNLVKLSITTSMNELYLKSIPSSVDSLEISHSGIVNIPPLDYSNSYLSYLKINNCLNLKTIGEEILNYDLLESLIITGNPNIERVTFDIVELDEIKYLELSDNPNLVFIPYFLSDASDYPKLETLIMKNMELNEKTVIMGSTEITEENILNVELGYEMGYLAALKNLEIDNVFFDDLIEHQFDFINYPNLERLRLANLGKTLFIPSISELQNLKELSIENLPVSNNLIDEISGLTGLTKLVLSDLNKLPEWGDLSSLSNLKHLAIKNIPNVSGIASLIKSFPDLEYLELENVAIDSGLSQSLKSLKKLKVLKINECEINDLVIDPQSLVNLEELELFLNEGLVDKNGWLDSIPLIPNLKKLSITTLYPEFIKSMNNLIELVIEYPKKDFPQIFHSNMKLEKLSIINSTTQQLPSSIGGLKDLKAFFLYATPVTSLVELMPLKNLEYIFLRRNGTLLDIPKQLNEMKNLKRIVYFHINNGALKNRLEEIFDEEKLITVNSKQEFINKVGGIINIEIER